MKVREDSEVGCKSLYLGHMPQTILDIDDKNNDKRNQKTTKEDWLHPEERTVFNNFDGSIVKYALVGLAIHLIDNGAN